MLHPSSVRREASGASANINGLGCEGMGGEGMRAWAGNGRRDDGLHGAWRSSWEPRYTPRPPALALVICTFGCIRLPLSDHLRRALGACLPDASNLG